MNDWWEEYIFPYDSEARNLSPRLYNQEIHKTVKDLMDWITSNIVYATDKERFGENVIQPPYITVELGQGNCVDTTALTATLLYLNEIPFRIVKGELFQNSSFVPHIWVEAKDPNGDIFYLVDASARILNRFKDQITYSKDRRFKEASPWIQGDI